VPVTEKVSDRLVRLPSFFSLGNSIERVIERARDYFRL